MSDKKVNLQALFDEQVDVGASFSYRAGNNQKNVASKTHKGKSISPEHYAKLQEGRKQAFADYEFSEKHKANQSKAAKERWVINPYIPTEEVKKKRSEGLKKYWAKKLASMPPKEVEPPKKRGRPRTHPEKDPNAPPKRRGRPPKVSSY